MAEIGCIASVIALVGTGTKLSIAIYDFAASVGNAGKDLQKVATEISDLCSVLKQLQTLLEHRHFQPSKTAIEDAQKIVDRCNLVLTEINGIVAGLRGGKVDEIFPSVAPDFKNKVKWTFTKSRVLVLRQTLEACKSTLSLMLMIMLLAERVSQRGHDPVTSLPEEEQEQVMTQSLVIAQQCAVEQLEYYEDEMEKEENVAMLLPDADAANRDHASKRRRSRGRLVRMFTGLSVVTDLPTLSSTPPRLPTRAERASVWLDSILTPEDEPIDPHPGVRKQKRLSSAGTAKAPQQLLRKWTDQAGNLSRRPGHLPIPQTTEESELWRDSKFSFPGSKLPSMDEAAAQSEELPPVTAISRASTDLISRKTARVQSTGFHVVVGVDGSLESSGDLTTSSGTNDSCEAITQTILQEYGASEDINKVLLCVSYGGKTKALKPSEKTTTSSQTLRGA